MGSVWKYAKWNELLTKVCAHLGHSSPRFDSHNPARLSLITQCTALESCNIAWEDTDLLSVTMADIQGVWVLSRLEQLILCSNALNFCSVLEHITAPKLSMLRLEVPCGVAEALLPSAMMTAFVHRSQCTIRELRLSLVFPDNVTALGLEVFSGVTKFELEVYWQRRELADVVALMGQLPSVQACEIDVAYSDDDTTAPDTPVDVVCLPTLTVLDVYATRQNIQGLKRRLNAPNLATANFTCVDDDSDDDMLSDASDEEAEEIDEGADSD